MKETLPAEKEGGLTCIILQRQKQNCDTLNNAIPCIQRIMPTIW